MFFIDFILIYTIIYLGFYKIMVIAKAEYDLSYANNDYDDTPPPYSSPKNPLGKP
jgi:hypothetical protein